MFLEEFKKVPSHAKAIKLMKDWRMYRGLLKGEDCDPFLIKFVEEKVSLYSNFLDGKVLKETEKENIIRPGIYDLIISLKGIQNFC